MTLLGIPFEFVLFAATLAGVALFHKRTLPIAVIGMLLIALYKMLLGSFTSGTGFAGFLSHLGHEWVILVNLLLLLVGFALLSKHFERSHLPEILPAVLPDDWKGPFLLLVIVFVLSAFLDNIAAALIGGSIAAIVFRHKVHVGYIAGIVAASNAGGSGSVVGDTTTTMMWLAGISPLAVLPAYIAAGSALLVTGVFASLQQHKFHPIMKNAPRNAHVDWNRLFIVAVILIAAIVVNFYVNNYGGEIGEAFPFLGVAVWVALLLCTPLRQPDWKEVPAAVKGAIFLLSLVFAASMMPVEKLPAASSLTAFQLGFVSAVFDNIPLTAMAIKQGGYDWGVLAYAVGFGGSMLWFGSSAGVAIATMFPQARSASAWLRGGWHVALAYVVGFAVMALVWGWHPSAKRGDAPKPAASAPSSWTVVATVATAATAVAN